MTAPLIQLRQALHEETFSVFAKNADPFGDGQQYQGAPSDDVAPEEARPGNDDPIKAASSKTHLPRP